MGTPLVDVEEVVLKINKERNKGLQFIFKGWFVIFALFYLLCVICRPIDHLVRYGIDGDNFTEVRTYMRQVIGDPVARVAFSYKTMMSQWFANRGFNFPLTNIISFIPSAVSISFILGRKDDAFSIPLI